MVTPDKILNLLENGYHGDMDDGSDWEPARVAPRFMARSREYSRRRINYGPAEDLLTLHAFPERGGVGLC